MSEKWLSIVGIGEDGISGLSAIAQSTLSQAQIVVS
jgi:precorrin-6Y C5,15-methyltransferase (decarboxylating)